jgi:redox-sensitive bicupin YhaK (pirin superfamily)
VSEAHREGYATVAFDSVPPAAPGYLEFGPLRLCGMEHFQPDYEGFFMHPHANIEIVTVVLAGTLIHRDSLGNELRVPAGSVQVMSAGRGIEHEEMLQADVDSGVTQAVQIMLDPRCQDSEPYIAHRAFSEAARADGWLTLASGRTGAPGLPIRQDAAVMRTKIDTDTHRTLTVEPGRQVYLLVISGEVIANGVQAGPHERLIARSSGVLVIHANREAEVLAIEIDHD